jgi:hypothetical protein
MGLAGDGECEERWRRDSRLKIIAKLATVLEVEPGGAVEGAITTPKVFGAE